MNSKRSLIHPIVENIEDDEIPTRTAKNELGIQKQGTS